MTFNLKIISFEIELVDLEKNRGMVGCGKSGK